MFFYIKIYLRLKKCLGYIKHTQIKQQKYIDHLNEESTKILFAVGPAGTGKTLIACNHALKVLTTGEVKRIVITRPVEPVEEEEIGFLPGNLNKKMDPWLAGLFQVLPSETPV